MTTHTRSGFSPHVLRTHPRPMFAFRIAFLLGLLSSLITCASAISTNFTIDDEFGDERTSLQPVYVPLNLWRQGASCTDCSVRPDASQIYRGTWHDTTHRPGGVPYTITLTFNGTAIYAFFLLANVRPNNITRFFPHTDVTFSLDGNFVGRYTYEPVNTTDYIYNVPVYSNSSLSNGLHEFRITASGEDTILVLFDRAIYTFDPDLEVVNTSTTTDTSNGPGATSGSTTGGQTSNSGPNIAAIVGGVIGGTLALVALTIAILWRCFGSRFRRNDRERQLSGPRVIDPFVHNPNDARGSYNPVSFSVGSGVQNSASASERDIYGPPTSPNTQSMSDSRYSTPVTATPPVPMMTRKAMMFHRELLEQQIREMEQSVSYVSSQGGRSEGADSNTAPTPISASRLSPSDTTQTRTTDTSPTVPMSSSDGEEVRRMIEGLRSEIGRLTTQLEVHNYQNELPPAY